VIFAGSAFLQQEPAGAVPDDDGDGSVQRAAPMRLELLRGADFAIVFIDESQVSSGWLVEHMRK
jgi:hypothetical protein